MNVYKTVEKQAKIFGLSITDFIGVLSIVFVYVILSTILRHMGLSFGIWGIGFMLIGVISLVTLLRYANKKKCPNYLIAIASFKYLQPKKIQPKCPLLKASPEYSKTKKSINH